MVNVLLFSQNVKLPSLSRYKVLKKNPDDGFLFLTTHMLFENERNYLTQIFGEFKCVCFADFLTDFDMFYCDALALNNVFKISDYDKNIKYIKNVLVSQKLLAFMGKNNYTGYILSDDLGIDKKVWLNAGFRPLAAEYYYK